MKDELIIVRYGEIGLKSKKTRKRFENTLLNNIRNALKKRQILFNIKTEWGRIYVYTDKIEKTIKVLTKIFGINSISPAIKTESKMESISKKALKISKEKIKKENSFALRVERTGDHNYSSQDVAVEIGNDIVKTTKASVNLTKPDFELFIEIRNNDAYLFTKKIPCAGGLPLRAQGNILVLIDSMDSILAAWYIMHRGCKPVFLNTKPSLSSVLTDFINEWYADQDIVMIDDKKNVHAIINNLIVKEEYDAIITGHSLYKDSKNIISDLKTLNDKATVPVIHPLIAMEKEEIKKKYKEIGIQK